MPVNFFSVFLWKYQESDSCSLSAGGKKCLRSHAANKFILDGQVSTTCARRRQGLRYFYRSLQRARLAVQQRAVMNALLPADISNSATAYYF